MNLGIVGHAEEKFTVRTRKLARQAIVDLLLQYEPVLMVSGASPMGGIDVWAEEIAVGMGITPKIFPPANNTWEGGFKPRNLQIASTSTHVAVIVVAAFPPGFKGQRFPYCYHCQDRNPKHVKSGGCWTAWRCPSREWIVLE